MTGLGQGGSMLLSKQLRLERVERVENRLQALQFLLLQRDLEMPPPLVMNQVVAERERVHFERLLEHRRGKGREVDAGREILAAEAAYRLAIDAQRVAFPGQAGDLERLTIERIDEIRGAQGEPDERVLRIERHWQRGIVLGPGKSGVAVEVSDIGVDSAAHLFRFGVD